jgi:hypothetical protein
VANFGSGTVSVISTYPFTTIQNSLNTIGSKVNQVSQETSNGGTASLTSTLSSSTIFTSPDNKDAMVTVSLGTTGMASGETLTIRYYTNPSSTSTFISKTVTANSNTAGFTDTAAAWKVVLVLSGATTTVTVTYAYAAVYP